jgi:hypothetical protein
MMKRFLFVWSIAMLATVCILQIFRPEIALARKLKVYRLPKSIAPGQLGIIVFENPDPSVPISRASCRAEKLIAWVNSDIPILRIEQNGKQIWTSLGSYQTLGDSSIGIFMAPLGMQAGPATVFLVNGRDPSIPYPLTIGSSLQATLTGVEGGSITPLGTFRVIGDGFLPTESNLDTKPAITELEDNIGYSKLPKAEQWTALNHRIMSDWDRIPEGDFLTIEQSGKTWRTFVQQCGLAPSGMTLDFGAPPDIQPGPATLTLSLRMNGQEVMKTAPLAVTIGP